MKSHVTMAKGKPSSRISNQQAVFQLKQRVVLALNKLADRDTYQIAVEELEKTIENLAHDAVFPFLSCILDTDSEQKSAVRKECIRLMGQLATFHDHLVGPHLGKMIASIVKRLKDTDSSVRDACVETVGVLASRLSGISVESDGVFVVLVRPLFEALGEQNKQVQYGSALCLSRVIDNIHDPPPSVLQKMLARTVKLLKNPHCLAKPAVVELNKSIILAGGASTHSSLTSALTSIQEALKNTEWATRKAACAALGDLASCPVSYLGSFRNANIRCLESCRFDKVKPVRDTALHALHLWKNLAGVDTPAPSEAGSSIKETSFRDDYGDITSASGSRLKDNIQQMKSGTGLVKKRIPLASRNSVRTYSDKSQQSGTNDWQIEIAIPKNAMNSVDENQIDESESSVTIKNIGYDYVEVDDKQECSSVSTLFTESIKSKVVNSHAFDDSNLVKSTGTSQRFAADEFSFEEQRYLAKMNDRRSLDSTVTDSTMLPTRGCCSKTEQDLMLIRKQLLEIENKQSDLMDMLKAFASSITDSMSAVQSKVSNLELVVEKMAQELVHGERYSDIQSNKITKRSPSIVSPRLSSFTPRPSVDSNRQPPLAPTKHAGIWDNNTYTRSSRSSTLGKQNSDLWSDSSQLRKVDQVFDPVPSTKTRVCKLETKTVSWKDIHKYMSDGDLDSAYGEALCSRNEFLLFELLDRTGPALENLSQKTASDLLGTLAAYLLDQRFVNSIIPWLQQLVDLCNIHGPSYLVLSAKSKRDFIFALQECSKVDVFKPAERKFLIELSKLLRQIWGNGPC